MLLSELLPTRIYKAYDAMLLLLQYSTQNYNTLIHITYSVKTSHRNQILTY